MAFPTTSVLDNFNRADAANLGANWSQTDTSWLQFIISSSAATYGATATVTYSNYYNVATYGADSEAYATISSLTHNGDSMGVDLRLQSPGGAGTVDGYHVEWVGNNTIDVYRIVNGAFTQLSTSISRTFSAGYKLGVAVTGTGATVTVEVFTDEGSGFVSRGSRTDTDGARITAAGNIGLLAWNQVSGDAVNKYDNFGGGTVVSGTTYNDIVSMMRKPNLTDIPTLTANPVLSLRNSKAIQAIANTVLAPSLSLMDKRAISVVVNSTIDSIVNLAAIKSITNTNLAVFETVANLGRLQGFVTWSNMVGVIISISMPVDLSEWTSTVTGGGNLSWAANAGLGGTTGGMSVAINDTTSIFGAVTLVTPDTSGKLRFRFYINPNTLTMANGMSHYIFNCKTTTSAGNDICEVAIYKDASSYAIVGVMYLDTGASVLTAIYDITTAQHYIEVYLQRATNSSSSDGSLALYIDDSLQETLVGRDNYDRFASFGYCKMGATFGVDATSSGTYYMDELVVNNTGNRIGPLNATYDDYLSFMRQQSISSVPFLSLNETLALLVSKGITVTPNLVLDSLLSLQVIKQQINSVLTTYETSLYLPIAVGFTDLGELTLNGIVTLSAIKGESNVGAFTFNNVVALQSAKSITDIASLTVDQTVSLSKINNISTTVLATLATTVAMQRSLNVSTIAANSLLASLGLQKQLSITSLSGLLSEGNISLGRVLAITTVPSLTVDQSITLSKQVSLSNAVNEILFTALALARTLSISTVGANTLDAAVAFLRSVAIRTLQDVGTQTFEDVLSLARSLAISTSTLATLNTNVALQKQDSITLDAVASLFSALSLSKTAAISTLSGLLISLVMSSLGKINRITDIANLTVETSIGLNKSPSMEDSVIGTLVNQLSMGKTVSISSTATVQFETVASIGRVLSITISSGFAFDETLSLQILQSLTTISDLIQFLGNLPAKLIIGDQVLWLIQANDKVVPSDIIDVDGNQSDLYIEDADNV